MINFACLWQINCLFFLPEGGTAEGTSKPFFFFFFGGGGGERGGGHVCVSMAKHVLLQYGSLCILKKIFKKLDGQSHTHADIRFID